ncbi:MAG: major facilitator superfamily 1 [Chloroflexi bacterium]|nr:major facilitator superfamily 1 [Chloroflexota bacterium]
MKESWQRILWVSWLAQVLAIVGFSFIYPFLPLYVQHLGVHDQHAVLIWSGVLYAGTTIAMTIFAPIWGAISDRYGRKVMVVRSMASGAIIIFLMIFVQNPGELLVLRILQGVLTGSVAASQALVSTAVPREKLGFSMGMMQMALFAGSSLGPLLGGQLDDHLGFQTTILIAAALLLAAAVMVTLYVDEDFKPAPRSATTRGMGFWQGARSLLSKKEIAILILVLGVVQFGGQIVGPILPVFVQELGGSSGNAATLAGNLFAIAGLGSAITAVLAGRITDRRGHFKLLLVLSTLATALIYIPQHSVQSIEEFYILRGLTGLTIGAMLATSAAMLTLSTPREQRGAVIGLSAGVNAAGQAVGQIAGSTVASVFGIRSVFLVTAGVLGIVTLVVGLGVHDPVAAEDTDAPIQEAEEVTLATAPPGN